jgi:hypothetical protein
MVGDCRRSGRSGDFPAAVRRDLPNSVILLQLLEALEELPDVRVDEVRRPLGLVTGDGGHVEPYHRQVRSERPLEGRKVRRARTISEAATQLTCGSSFRSPLTWYRRKRQRPSWRRSRVCCGGAPGEAANEETATCLGVDT